MTNAPVIFYHLWPVGEWKRVNKNILTKVVDSGLASVIDKMYICVNTNLDFSEIPLYGIDVNKIEFIRINDTQSEWPTLETLFSKYYGVDNTPILYFHCKGARFITKDNTYNAINSWVDGMVYYNITKWRKCLNYLSYNKLSVGIRVARLPVPHYSGNFWWINSTALKFLINPKTQDQSNKNRHGAEFWLSRLGVNNLFDMDMLRNQFGYTNVIDSRRYMECDRSEKSACIYKNGNQDTLWSNRLGIDFDIYEKNKNIKRNSKVEAYVKYIVDNYEDLPNYTFFLTSSAIITIHNLEQFIKNQYKKFQPFGRNRVKDTNSGLPNHPGLPIKQKWSNVFSDECPDIFEFTADSNFGVSRSEILMYSKDFYKSILNNLDKIDNPLDDFCFERIWETMFTKSYKEKQELSHDIFPNLLSSKLENIAFFTPGKIINRYSDIVINTLGDDKSDYWNIISNNLNTDKLVFVSANVNYEELKQLIESNFKLNSRVQSQYIEFSFDEWNAIVVEKEIFIKNKSKKKSFIAPFVDTLSQKLLLLPNGS